MTTYDFMARRFMDPVKMQRMLTEPEGMNDVFHFTPTNEHDVYPYIDVRENKSLMQTGKVVLITGASRGIGRVSEDRTPHSPFSSFSRWDNEMSSDVEAEKFPVF